MQLPDVVKQIGKANGAERVYVEDYVYTYLNELKKEKEIFPLRVALFGHVYHKEVRNFYLVYGAACVIDELEYGRNEEQVRKEYFENYELIGYVNIYGNGQELPGKKEGYYVFYEKNESMQNYLLSCYERRSRRRIGREEEKSGYLKEASALTPKKLNFSIGDTIKKIFYGGCIILLALAVTTINEYSKMQGFVEAADRVIALGETEN